MAETIAKKYLESLPRPKLAAAEKVALVLAAAVVLVVAAGAGLVGASAGPDRFSDGWQMANIQNTVGDTVEEQVNAALEQVTSLVEFFDYSVVQVNLAENSVTFDLAVQLRQRTADTPVIWLPAAQGRPSLSRGRIRGEIPLPLKSPVPSATPLTFPSLSRWTGEPHPDHRASHPNGPGLLPAACGQRIGYLL